MTSSRNSRTVFIAALLLFVIVALFYWKITLTNQYTWLESPDLANMVLPWFQFQAGEWHQGRFPMWDPNESLGQPLIGQGQPGAAYPLNWLLFLAPLKNGWIRQSALHWYYVLIHFLAALNMFVFCRSLERSFRASVLGACVYALGGYAGNVDWPQMVNGAVWTPLVFLFLFRAEAGRRPYSSAMLSGFFLGLGWLAGHHQMNLFVSLTAVLLWGWLALRERRIDWRIVRLAALSLTVAIMASAFQTLPIYEFGRRALRWTGSPQDPIGLAQKIPYSVHDAYRMKPEGLLGIFLPGVSSGYTPYIGIAAFGLAFLGAALAWRLKQVRWLAAVGLGGILFSLGGDSLFHGWMYALVPMVEKSRVPAAGLLLFTVGAAPLAAFGVDLLQERSKWIGRVVWALAGVALLIGSLGVIGYLGKIPALETRIQLTALAAALAAAVIAGWNAGKLSPALGSAALLGITLFELASMSTFYYPNSADKDRTFFLHSLAEDSNLASLIREQQVGGRTEYDDQLIPYNFGDWYGVETMNGYTASVLDNIWGMDMYSERGKQFFGVRYSLGKKGQENQKEVYAGKRDMKVFEYPSPYPRAWSVHRTESVRDLPTARRRFIAQNFDPRSQAFVVKRAAPDVEICSGQDEVAIPLREPNYLRITAKLGCKGLVILSDPWYPGWRASVDSHPAEILEIDGGVRGVIVGPGDHTVVMRYRPLSVYLGAALSFLSLLLVLFARHREPRIDSADSPPPAA
jgi:hypothetical protein